MPKYKHTYIYKEFACRGTRKQQQAEEEEEKSAARREIHVRSLKRCKTLTVLIRLTSASASASTLMPLQHKSGIVVAIITVFCIQQQQQQSSLA